ncbi:DNA damage-binding protein 2 isoform X1 [Acanthopagrus latus]|uniref:DNA damage-binding protein 2 isoform X1 n=1 Tax=Acanthopagrus latus TaxID=8177 RepID=UPI00187C67EA|nr:DNA damage-binding protein 2 isoform X1 [Acanthopagrus latus]XP_036963150.1 DNA damage-binding protein 2 isoform X1 [Acanthopagrus latus]XP_036963151.1 DNA damage-binding protein 2 isoform X1 [Acanthopagrus latus]XP_036963152.1 DNA damage-binding protein 2 isoform X1 [Acanthopagrus latus]XP_036963153.1 DNA damage-binding protein 2 isoform X1 [Acanthopagrus latus]
MKRPTKSNASEPKGKVKKRAGESSATTLSRKLRDKKDGEKSKQGPPLKPAAVQKRTGYGSILHYIYKSTLGQSLHSRMRQCLQEPFVRSLSSYHFHGATSPFDRRITCLEWHPTHPTTLAVGSKGGDLYLWDYETPTKQTFIQGNGAGDFIGGMRFCPTDLSKVYVASGEGTLTVQSFEGHTPTVLSRTQDCGHDHHNVCYWYCCVDVSVSRQMLVTGDNVGELTLLGLDGQKIFKDKLHKAKVTHAEFNLRCDWLLATASVDHTVKLWDLRNIKDKESFLHELPHDKAVNSAYFNPLDCSKLLTTDQYDQIRVYSSSDWSKPQHIIQHPHRQFQHLTPIKATWHPVYDLVVAGRYPDDRVCPGDQRTVDIYDANTAELVYQLQDPAAAGIKSVNKFNPMGEVIGTGMGVTVLVWDRNESLLSDHPQQEETSTSADSLRGQRRSQQRSSRDRRGPAVDAKLKKKLASLEESGTKTKTKTGCTKQKQAQTRKK